MTDHFDEDRIAHELRASLDRHAREAPRGDLLAERIIRTTDAGNGGRRRPDWRTWSLPLIAAAAVAGVVATIAGIQALRPTSGQPATSQSGSVLQQPATPLAGTRTVSSPPSTASPTAHMAPLRQVKILDLTFVSQNEGWALASAHCVTGAGRCTALFHTKGTTWWSMPNSTPFNVAGVRGGCSHPCVTNIRFANPRVGYAFGPSAFLMTQDGGRHWTPEPGGALALESLDNNVIRVIAASPSGCPGPCGIQVETSPIGSTTWTRADLPAVSGSAISFSRGQPSNAYLLVKGNPAGGAQNETSTLYRSIDDGAHWTSFGEPCSQANGEADSVAVTGGGPNEVTVLCTVRQAPHRSFVAISTDGAGHFSPAAGSVPAGTEQLLTGDPTTVLLSASNGMAISTDGGRTWHRVPAVSGSIGFVGFESPTVGRAVSADGHTIWTTQDGGVSWSAHVFG